MNIMDEYIKLAKKEISEYVKLMFGKKASRQIADEYLETYINARYYNLNPNRESNTFRTDILEAVNNAKDEMLLGNPREEEAIQNVFLFYRYIMYFDNVIKAKDLKKIVEEIYNWRVGLFKAEDKDFIKNLTKLIHESAKENSELLDKLSSSEFYLSFSNYLGISNVQRATLKYDIKFPKIFSNWALDKAFTTGTVGEDRFFVAFSLISVQCLHDVIKGNFTKQYIIDFGLEVFEKEQKKNRLLKIIDNQVLQDKLALKLSYKDYIANKNDIEDMMRDGFKFAIVLDDTFEAELFQVGKLNIFEFIITKNDASYYSELMSQKDIAQKIIAL